MSDSTSIEVSWQPPLSDLVNGLVREYIVYAMEIETGVLYVQVVQTLSISLNYLHPNYHYNVTVSAVTVASGPYSYGIVIHLPEDGK